jgi:hypothetical protein
MRLSPLASLVVLLAPSPAFASGGIACSSEGGQARFEVSAAMGRDFGAGIFDVGGTLESSEAGIGKELQRLSYSLETPHQVWLDRDILYFELMVARPGNGPYGSSDLVIKTTAVDEGSFKGDYKLTMQDTGSDGVVRNVVVSGRASCVAD